MKPTRTRAAIFTGLALAALTFSSAPAFADPAHTVPTGSTLYASGCTTDIARLYSTDVTTGVVSVVGTDPGAMPNYPVCAVSGAWDPISRYAYVNHVTIGPSALYRVDVASGVSTLVGGYLVSGTTTSANLQLLAILPDGRAYGIGSDASFGGQSVYSLDLATAAVNRIAALSAFSSYVGFSADPTTGVLTLLDTGGQLSTLDGTTGAVTPGATLVFGSSSASVQSASFDSNGLLWIFTSPTIGQTDLWSVDPDDIVGTQQRAAALTGTSSQSDPRLGSMFVAPTGAGAVAPVVPATTATTAAANPVTSAAVVAKPALAETGVDEGRTLTILGSSALAILLGAGLTLVARARRRASL